MESIKIKLLTIGGDEHDIETPTDMKVKDFISELAIVLSLPVKDADGISINWRLDCKDTGKRLLEELTLEENNVLEGFRLLMIRQTVAGMAVFQHSTQLNLSEASLFSFSW